MADQKIELEIVLDDGSIKKAFATIRKEAEDVAALSGDIFNKNLSAFQKDRVAFFKEEERRLVNSAQAFNRFQTSLQDTVKKSAAESAKVFQEQFDKSPVDILSKDTLVSLSAGVFLFKEIVNVAGDAANAFKHLALEAERINVTQAQFLQLTKENGISAGVFQDRIRESIDGLIGLDDALQIANQAMIRIGVSALRLPEIFELARKAAAAGFGELTSNAEAFIYAIQTGQTRQLRGLGVTVSVTKAQKEYADSVGLTVDQLSEERKALINSQIILDAVEKKFGNVDASVRSFSDSLARMNAELKEAAERKAVLFSNVYGGLVKNAIDNVTLALRGNTEQLSKNLDTTPRLRLLVNIYDLITGSSDRYRESEEKTSALLSSELTKRIKTYQTFLKLKEEERLKSEELALFEQNKAKANEQYTKELIGYQQQELAARQQNVRFIQDEEAKAAEQKSIYNQQKLIEEETYKQQVYAIEKSWADSKFIDDAQRKALLEEAERVHRAKMAGYANQYHEATMDDLDRFVENADKNYKKLGTTARITFYNQIGGAFAAFGQALAKGEDAMAAFGKAILGILGDIAIQMGQSFILQGIAHSLNPLTPGSGAGLIAAGAALSIFGGVLKGLAGGGGGTGSTNTGGGLATQGADTGAFTAASPIADTRIQPNTVVNFTIQGDVLDSDSTQARIVQLLNDAIDTKGAVVRGI